jgi:hypothetical protein
VPVAALPPAPEPVVAALVLVVAAPPLPAALLLPLPLLLLLLLLLVAAMPPLPAALLLPLPPTPLVLDVVPAIWHSPARQAPPVQGVLSFLFTGEHTPSAGLQSAVWHSPTGGQTTTSAPLHVPLWHVSVFVQASPSSQAAPVAFDGALQRPVVGSHAPASWHWSCAAQTTGLAPAQIPAWQVSSCVQASPSLQEAPLAFAGVEQTPVALLQIPAMWH